LFGFWYGKVLLWGVRDRFGSTEVRFGLFSLSLSWHVENSTSAGEVGFGKQEECMGIAKLCQVSEGT